MKTGRKVEVILFVIAFAAGGYLAGLTAGGQGHHAAQATDKISESQTSHKAGHHSLLEASSENPYPTVRLAAYPDPVSGWNLHIVTENFQFAPQSAGREHVDGEGHAHLYLDDQKIARLYGAWYHLGALEPGTHQLKVTLNTNNHELYAVNGNAVVDSLTLGTSQ